MNEKRYVIVTVDKVLNCPIYVGITGFCEVNDCGCDDCKMKTEKGNYGDTKEQLIKKVMTAFKIAIKKNKEGKFVKEKSSNRQVAEIVVEFLGVK